METNFNEIKQEILRRAKKAGACKDEYSRAYATKTLSELSQVIKDNFYWVCNNGILTVDLIEQYKEDFAANDIYVNQNVKNGYLLCYNATVEAYGNAIVEAYGNTKVVAYDHVTVETYGNTSVKVYNNATVRAYNNTTVKAYSNATIEAHDSAMVKAFDHSTVETYDNVSVKAYDSSMIVVFDCATVETYDNTYCTSYYTIDCKLFDHAIYRVLSTNTIYYADSDIKFVKQ